MNSRPCIARTISFDSADTKDKAPSTSEHRRQSHDDDFDRRAKHGTSSRKKSHSDGRHSPKRSRSRKSVRPSDVSESPTFDSRAITNGPKSPRSKHSSKSKRTNSSSDKRSKKSGEKRTPSRSKSRRSNNKRHPNQDSVSASSFGASSFDASFATTEEQSMSFSAAVSKDSSRRDSEALSKSGTLLSSESVRTGFDVDTPPREFVAPQSGLNLNLNLNLNQGKKDSCASIANSSTASALEGLSDEQKLWAGITRVLEAYGDNGSVATHDVLPAAVMKALADSYSTFNSNALPTVEPSEQKSRFSSALSIDENFEQNFDDVPMNQPSGPGTTALGDVPALMNTSFTSLMSDLQSLVGPDGKPTVPPSSKQEETIKALIDTVATVAKQKGDPTATATASGNKDMFEMFSWAQQKAGEHPIPPPDGTSKQNTSQAKDERLQRQSSKRNKKAGSSNSKSSRSRSSPSHSSNRKRHGDLRKQESKRRSHNRNSRSESHRNVHEDDQQEEQEKQGPVTTTREGIQRSEHTEPIDLSDFDKSLDQRRKKADTEINQEIVEPIRDTKVVSGPDLHESAKSFEMPPSASEPPSHNETDLEGDESYDHFDTGGGYLSPVADPSRPTYNVHDEGNNSMPSLSTLQETDIRPVNDDLADKMLSYGDLGYEEANDGAPLSPVRAKLYPETEPSNYVSPEASPRLSNLDATSGSLLSPYSPFKYLKRPKLRSGKVNKKKKKVKKKKSPANSTASTEPAEPAEPNEDLATPDDFQGFFRDEEEDARAASPQAKPPKPKSRMSRISGLTSILQTPRKSRFKDGVHQTPLSQLRKGVMKLPFFGKKTKRSPAVIDTGRRDAQFYPDREESDHSFGALLN